ncbi:MAG: GNAT family N-acetyltransferase [Planctomycetota bacterium]
MNCEDRISYFSERFATADEAVLNIPRGKHIFIGSGAAQPVSLVEALSRRASYFSDNTIVHLMTLGPAPYVDPAVEGHFRHNAFFIGSNVRKAVHEGRADYTPVFLSQIPSLIQSRRLPIDVALIQCSPPDEFGFVNLGVSVDIALAAIDAAAVVIAEINPRVPIVHGAGFIRMDQIHHWVLSDAPLVEYQAADPDPVSEEIGRQVATLIEDGNTLQLGIGQIPDATLRALHDRRSLGIWTEMFSDGVLDLVEAGVITGRHKTIHPGKISSSFTFGSRRLYEFLDRNPLFTFHPSDFINDPIRIAKQHKMVAINSALEVDLTGQVCADSIGTKFYSGIGGQVDFIRGASMCSGGKPIIALPSTAKGGTLSRIVACLTKGAGVVTSRGDVRYVVTEYGIADLQGKSIRERAIALTSIAHPDFRAELLDEAKERHYVFPDQLEPRGTYPRELEKKITASSGDSLLLRPIRVTDEPKVSSLFYSLGENTLYKRFQRVVKRVPHQELQYFLDVDYEANMAIVLETCMPGRESEIIGIAQYLTDRESGYAEVAFVIRDEWQGKGLGSSLIQALVEAARDKHVKGFIAEVLPSNQAMLRVFEKSGLAIQRKLVDKILRLTMPLGEAQSGAKVPGTVAPHSCVKPAITSRSGARHPG